MHLIAGISYIFAFTAIRSGDYYMFDEFDDTDIHMNEEESSSDEDAPREMGIGKVSCFIPIRELGDGNR